MKFYLINLAAEFSWKQRCLQSETLSYHKAKRANIHTHTHRERERDSKLASFYEYYGN